MKPLLKLPLNLSAQVEFKAGLVEESRHPGDFLKSQTGDQQGLVLDEVDGSPVALAGPNEDVGLLGK